MIALICTSAKTDSKHDFVKAVQLTWFARNYWHVINEQSVNDTIPSAASITLNEEL